MKRSRTQVVALTVLWVMGVGVLVGGALWYQHLSEVLNPYRVLDADPAVQEAADDIADQPDVVRADAQGELADGSAGEQLRGAEPAGSVPVRWSLRADGRYATTFTSDRGVPPPAALRAMGAVPAAPASAHLEVRWIAAEAGTNPEHSLVVHEVMGPRSTTEQEQDQQVLGTVRDALAGSGVPFAVQVEASGGRVLFRSNHW